ncbi:MAG: NTP transferase domain-containing protein [Bacteroidetes bacterium]|nr:NTP transferase domain-containing protein [Bacteroidota bacterium]
MKAIIPVAGVGTRLRPHTHTQPKALVPVAGKPILGHIVDGLMDWGIDEFVFIIGYMGDKIEKYIQKAYPDINTFFVLQPDGMGTAHALWLARDVYREEESVLIVLGDTIFKASAQQVLTSEFSTIGIKKVNDPRQFGVVEVDNNGFVTRLVEKPAIPKSNLALIGVYKINNVPLLIEGLRKILEDEKTIRGEYHLTDALMYMVEKGEKMKTFAAESWFDCGKKEILLETNAILLRRLEERGYQTDQVENTIIVPPVHLGRGVKVSNSIIGPNVSIGEDTEIHYSIIQNSIIGHQSNINEVNLRSSVIGNDNTLSGSNLSLNLGDSTEIKMG